MTAGVLATASGVPAGDRDRARERMSLLLGAAVAAAAVLVALRERQTLASGVQLLTQASPGWLLVGLVATAALWGANTLTQLGALPVRPPFRQMLAVQVTASLANQAVPSGLGGMAVNVRFLTRFGLSRRSAMTAVTLAALASGAMAVVLALAVLAVPGVVTGRVASALPAGPWVPLVAVAVVTAALGGGGLWWSRRRRAGAPAWQQALSVQLLSLRAVLRTPTSAAQLWVGAVLERLLPAVVLLAAVRSLAPASTAGTIVAVFLVASVLSALLPAPGAVGPLDVLLVGGLVAAGLPAATAAAAVLGFRLLTVWVPLIPAALTSVVLLSRRML